MKINGYEIVAIIPAKASTKSGWPEVWYLVGVKSDAEAVSARTYDLEAPYWSQGYYVDLTEGAEPGAAFHQALSMAMENAGMVFASDVR